MTSSADLLKDLVRIHQLPRVCMRNGIGKISPKTNWYRKHSLDRYLKDPKQAELHAALNRALFTGEIGRFESVRFIESKGNK